MLAFYSRNFMTDAATFSSGIFLVVIANAKRKSHGRLQFMVDQSEFYS